LFVSVLLLGEEDPVERGKRKEF